MPWDGAGEKHCLSSVLGVLSWVVGSAARAITSLPAAGCCCCCSSRCGSWRSCWVDGATGFARGLLRTHGCCLGWCWRVGSSGRRLLTRRLACWLLLLRSGRSCWRGCICAGLRTRRRVRPHHQGAIPLRRCQGSDCREGGRSQRAAVAGGWRRALLHLHLREHLHVLHRQGLRRGLRQGLRRGLRRGLCRGLRRSRRCILALDVEVCHPAVVRPALEHQSVACGGRGEVGRVGRAMRRGAGLGVAAALQPAGGCSGPARSQPCATPAHRCRLAGRA